MSPIPSSLLRLVLKHKNADKQQFCDLVFHASRERIPSSPTISFLAVPVPSNSLGIQQKSNCLAGGEKSSQPKSLKSKLKVNLANTSTTLKHIGTTPVRRSFKSTVEEAVMVEEVEMLDDDEVFIKDLDLNIVHKLSLRDMPFLPALF